VDRKKDRKGNARVASFHFVASYFITSPGAVWCGVMWCDVVFKLQCTT
jgi:hypothetical protein